LQAHLRNRAVFALCIWLTFSSCQHSQPKPFGIIEYPADNQQTEARIALGKKLYFEKRISVGQSISCATCHQPLHAFASSTSLAPSLVGHGGLLRNVPTLINVAYLKNFFCEGAVHTLEIQALGPMASHEEMGISIKKSIERLSQEKEIDSLSMKAYSRPFDAYVLSRALAAYERTLISNRSPYDSFMAGNKSALTKKARAGEALFNSPKTDCATCHTPPLFSSARQENIGLAKHYVDPGFARLTQNPLDSGKFKTPTLRNLAFTAPYMHNGSLQTIDQVLVHYNKGGAGHKAQSKLVRPLHLTQNELACLKAFLLSLTDSAFVRNALQDELNAKAGATR